MTKYITLFLLALMMTLFGDFSNCMDVHAASLENMDSYEENRNALYSNFEEQINLTKLSNRLKHIQNEGGLNQAIDFGELFQLFVQGDAEQAIKIASDHFLSNATSELLAQQGLISELFIIIILAAIFRNYASIFHFSYIGEQGFYVTYLMIALLLMQSFRLSYEVAVDVIYYIEDLMTSMLPAFCTSLLLCGGMQTAQFTNASFLSMLTLAERVLFFVILPGIRIYFLIAILNPVNAKDRFSKLASFIQQILRMVMKYMVEGIVGLNFIKSLIVPYYDKAQYVSLKKGLLLLPGGKTIEGAGTIFFAALLLIKNSVGICIVIILLVFASIPLLKLLSMCMVYKVLIALLQPVSDRRILDGLQGISNSLIMLFYASTVSISIIILSIGILLMTTNIGNT